MDTRHRLVVDDRWFGRHGIGRYSAEVLPRLTMQYERLRGRRSPSSALDPVSSARLRLPKDCVLYSPGYNCGPTRARQLVTLHDLIHLRGNSAAARARHRYYEWIVRPAVRRAGHVMTVSHASAELISEWINDHSVSVHVTGNGCSDAFSVSGDAHFERRPYVLYVGNLKEHKNFRVAIRALAALPDFHFVVVTQDGPAALKVVRELSMEERVRVVSNVTDGQLARLYRGAHCLLFPSLEEGFGLPVLEALRCGCPVLYYAGCSSARDIAGSFTDTVEVSERSDVEAWRSAVLSVAKCGRPKPIGVDQFAWSTVAASVNSVLEQICER